MAENGEFLVAILRAAHYTRDMSRTLEKRVKELETKVAKLSAQPVRSNRKKDWRRTIGVFRNDPEFEEAVRLGREYRVQQTYDKEIAGS
jgi:hypothetical protein